jgi:hypothetical protein
MGRRPEADVGAQLERTHAVAAAGRGGRDRSAVTTGGNRPLPGWPEGLSEDLAAAYLSISVSLFRREWQGGRLPKPRWITPGRQIWHRAQLQAWLDAKFDLENDPVPPPIPSAEDEWDLACGAREPALS